MKKVLILLAVLAATVSCAQAQESKKNNKKTNKTEQSDKKMKPITMNKALFLEKVANFETNPNEWKYLGDKPALIDFYATWCGPCKQVAPILEELAAEYGDRIVIYKVDTDKERDLAAAFGIRSIPSLLFVPMEGQPQMAQGAMSKTDFKKIIDDVLLKK